MLHVTIQPRYSIFLESDESGSFIVNAALSNYFGQPYPNPGSDRPGGSPFTTLSYDITSEESGALLVSGSVSVDSTGNIVQFPLSSLAPRLQPYPVSIRGTSPDGQQRYSASTEIYILPSRTYGSAVKIDNLYGGLYVQNAHNNWSGWYAVFPNGAYGDGKHLIPSNTDFTNLDTYASQGFNTISIVPDGGLPDQSYPTAELAHNWDHMDALNLFNIYELRFAFQNATRIREQVALWQHRTTLLMWYTADEPDGWGYPLNSTAQAYAQLRALDPYHPVSLALNCQNFHYAAYSAGADIVLEDAYPVGINGSWSVKWNTPCNTTYGDCGCDHCDGALADVASRLDDLQSYQRYLDGPASGPKPTWAVIQVFGAQDYWARLPSVEEVRNMMVLAVNHDAKGLTYWLYPSTAEINAASGELGKVFQGETALGFLFNAHAIKGLPVVGGLAADASAWIVGPRMMVGFASAGPLDFRGTVEIVLPVSAAGVEEVLFGEEGWVVNGRTLSKTGVGALEVGVLVLNLA